ncbi:hypothetical protein GL263_09180 [Streptomyces durbertensis]|uniref:Zinc-finger domain-containing protein n=1 Tax=Streptomyces durbertensis TaxID=2448886 RepID=A0ABR6EEI1_9ACTN|nr:hypothetical protein [Streptomyces durbertensis]MBB1243731.1 hypothetical protein [Streptomyces durbertensis]
MPHIDGGRLTELALAHTPAVGVEAAHLAHCARCRTELAATRRVVRAVRGATRSDRAGYPHRCRPPARLWRAIEAAVREAAPQDARQDVPGNAPRDAPAEPPGPGAPGGPAAPDPSDRPAEPD